MMRKCLQAALALACALAACAAAACERHDDDALRRAVFAPKAHAHWVHGASQRAKPPLPRHLRYLREKRRARVVHVRREIVTHITIVERLPRHRRR